LQDPREEVAVDAGQVNGYGPGEFLAISRMQGIDKSL